MNPFLEGDLIPKTYQCGPGGHIRLNELLKELQEIASVHADRLGLGMKWMMENGYMWVLVDIKIHISRFPRWNENCTVYTMPSGYDSIRAYREFTVQDMDGIEIMRATSSWIVIDRNKRAPVMTEDLNFDFSKRTRRNFDEIIRGRIPENMTEIHSTKVGSSSIDLNGHVNNTEFVRWVIDGLSFLPEGAAPIDFIEHDILMSFRSEVFEGDTVHVRHFDGNGTSMISIFKGNERNPSFTMEIS